MFSSTEAQFASRPPFGHIWALAILMAFSRMPVMRASVDILSRVIMKKFTVCFVVFLMSATATFAADDEHEQDRVRETGTVLKEILNIPDDIPRDLLDKAECVIILPSVKKGAFGIGGSYGRGVMVCRSGAHYKGRWGAPALYALEGVSIGFQLGGQATDFVMNAEILSYSRNKGLFAGVSLEGSTLRSDGSANEKLYGKKLSAKEIIREGRVGVPACAHELDSLLNTKSPINRSDPKSLE